MTGRTTGGRWVKGFLKPTPPPYVPVAWQVKPFPEQVRLVCQAWAVQGYGTPLGAHDLYVFKVIFYIYAWALFCAFTPGMGNIGDWQNWRSTRNCL